MELTVFITNFKSFTGENYVGPLKGFTAISGPSATGKADLMDALSFVLVGDINGGSLVDLISKRHRDATVRVDVCGEVFSRRICESGDEIFQVGEEVSTKQQYLARLESLGITNANIIRTSDLEAVASGSFVFEKIIRSHTEMHHYAKLAHQKAQAEVESQKASAQLKLVRAKLRMMQNQMKDSKHYSLTLNHDLDSKQKQYYSRLLHDTPQALQECYSALGYLRAEKETYDERFSSLVTEIEKLTFDFDMKKDELDEKELAYINKKRETCLYGNIHKMIMETCTEIKNQLDSLPRRGQSEGGKHHLAEIPLEPEFGDFEENFARLMNLKLRLKAQMDNTKARVVKINLKQKSYERELCQVQSKISELVKDLIECKQKYTMTMDSIDELFEKLYDLKAKHRQQNEVWCLGITGKTDLLEGMMSDDKELSPPDRFLDKSYYEMKDCARKRKKRELEGELFLRNIRELQKQKRELLGRATWLEVTSEKEKELEKKLNNKYKELKLACQKIDTNIDDLLKQLCEAKVKIISPENMDEDADTVMKNVCNLFGADQKPNESLKTKILSNYLSKLTKLETLACEKSKKACKAQEVLDNDIKKCNEEYKNLETKITEIKLELVSFNNLKIRTDNLVDKKMDELKQKEFSVAVAKEIEGVSISNKGPDIEEFIKIEFENKFPYSKIAKEYNDMVETEKSAAITYEEKLNKEKEILNLFETEETNRLNALKEAFGHIKGNIGKIYKNLTHKDARVYVEMNNEHVWAMEQLFLAEKTMGALAFFLSVLSLKQPSLVILDEVDAALDEKTAAKIADYMPRQCQEENRSIYIGFSRRKDFYTRASTFVSVYRDHETNYPNAFKVDITHKGRED